MLHFFNSKICIIIMHIIIIYRIYFNNRHIVACIWFVYHPCHTHSTKKIKQQHLRFYVILNLLRVWLIAILNERTAIKNIKLLKLEEEDDNSEEEEEEECVISDVKIPIFNIAFADSSSNARSSPLIKFFFIMLCFCCMILSSVAWACDLSFLFCRLDVIGLIIIDLMIVFIIGTIVWITETAIIIATNISIVEVIKEMNSWLLI